MQSRTEYGHKWQWWVIRSAIKHSVLHYIPRVTLRPIKDSPYILDVTSAVIWILPRIQYLVSRGYLVEVQKLRHLSWWGDFCVEPDAMVTSHCQSICIIITLLWWSKGSIIFPSFKAFEANYMYGLCIQFLKACPHCKLDPMRIQCELFEPVSI